MDGWIKLHRKIQDHWIYQEKRKFSRYEAWLDMIMMANHKGNRFLHGSELIEVERGQFVTSEIKLMDRWDWGKNKIRLFLDLLEKDGMIVRKADRKRTTITICNYGLYHDSETKNGPQADHERTTDGPSADTNKNVKNVKNDENVKEDINNSAEPVVQHEGYHVDFESFWTVFPKFRRKDKAKTFGIWKKKIKESERQLLIQCTERYAADKKTIGPNGQFAKMPSTYLNAGTYKDYLSGGDENETIQSSTGSTGKYSEFTIE